MPRSHKNRPAFTLLELLISVAIFSGLAVLTLAIFARSATSSVRSNVSRQRTEAARNLIDRVTTDMRYVYMLGQVVNEQGTVNGCGGAGGPYYGFDFSGSCLKVLIKFPNSLDNELVLKNYNIDSSGTVSIRERRGCELDRTRTLQCSGGSDSFISLMSDKYKIDLTDPIFSGEDADSAAQSNRVPYLRTKFTIKPSDLTGECSANKSLCYTISSTITVGEIQ